MRQNGPNAVKMSLCRLRRRDTRLHHPRLRMRMAKIECGALKVYSHLTPEVLLEVRQILAYIYPTCQIYHHNTVSSVNHSRYPHNVIQFFHSRQIGGRGFFQHHKFPVKGDLWKSLLHKSCGYPEGRDKNHYDPQARHDRPLESDIT